MRRGSTERGAGNLGCIVWVIVLALGCLIAYKVIPVKVKTSELYDHMVEVSKYGARSEPEEIKKDILATAQRLELPLDKEHLRVERNGDRLLMEATYTVPIQFPGYTYQWHADHKIDVPIFIF